MKISNELRKRADRPYPTIAKFGPLMIRAAIVLERHERQFKAIEKELDSMLHIMPVDYPAVAKMREICSRNI